MPDFFKARAQLFYSEASDYQPNQFDGTTSDAVEDSTVTAPIATKVSAATSAGTNYQGASHLTSLKGLFVQNNDSTNYVVLTFDDREGNTNTLQIDAGDWTYISDIDPTATINLTANTAACRCTVAGAGVL